VKAFFHPKQHGHAVKTRFARGRLLPVQEVPARIEYFIAAARAASFAIHQPDDHGTPPIEAVHAPDYVDFLRTAHAAWEAAAAAEGGDWGNEVVPTGYWREANPRRGILGQAAYYLTDACTPLGTGSWEAIYWSAQSAIAGAQALLDGDLCAYAICRPPGHHAGPDAGGGFCYLNNAAIAAQHLRRQYPRVAILDTDMHHGQGTQQIFYRRDDVLYVSIHADPTNFYPGFAGFADETGAGPGQGYNLNLPMAHGTPESTFFGQLDTALTALRDYRPGALVLSLGFDIFTKDPQSRTAVSTAGFARLGMAVGNLGIPLLVVQEGGYYLPGLEDNTKAFFDGLAIKSRG
jgi:acetoin utilization deacetylase AcuC-like enzyme